MLKGHGFTTIELIVVVAVVGLLSVAVMMGQRRGLDERKLILEARSLAQDIRRVQNWALSSASHNCAGVKVVPFGLVLDTDTSDRYLLVADCDEDKIYDALGDPVVKTALLESSKISDLNPKSGGGALEIFFSPPLPSVAVNGSEADSAAAVITLCSAGDPLLCRSVSVNSRGAVSIQ